MNYKEKLDSLHESLNDIPFRRRQFKIEAGGDGYFVYGKDITKRDIIKIAKTLRPGEEKRPTLNLTIGGNTIKEPMVIRRLESFKKESAKVDNLLKDIKRKGLLDDRREYDVDDLKSAYPELSKQEAEELYNKIRKESFSRLDGLHESVFGRIRGYDLQYQEDILKDWEELKQAYKGNKNEAIKELKQVWPQLTQNDLNLIKKESFSAEGFKKISDNSGKKFGGYIKPDDKRIKSLDVGIGDIVSDGNKWYAIEESSSRLDRLHESVLKEARDYKGLTLMRGDTVKIHPKVTKDPLNRQGKKGVVNRILGNDEIEVLFPDRKKGKYSTDAVILLSGAGSESVSTAIGVTNSRDAVKLLRKLDYDVQDIGAGKINVYGSHSDYEDAVEELRNANLLRESTSKKEAVFKNSEVQKYYDSLKKKSTDEIFKILKQVGNVVSKSNKEDMIYELIEIKFGRNKMENVKKEAAEEDINSVMRKYEAIIKSDVRQLYLDWENRIVRQHEIERDKVHEALKSIIENSLRGLR